MSFRPFQCSGCESSEDVDGFIAHGEQMYCLRCRTCPHGFVQLAPENVDLYCCMCLVRPFMFRTPSRSCFLLLPAVATLYALSMDLATVLDIVGYVWGDPTSLLDEASILIDRVYDVGYGSKPGAPIKLTIPPAHLVGRRHLIELFRDPMWKSAFALVHQANGLPSPVSTRVPSLRPHWVGARTG